MKILIAVVAVFVVFGAVAAGAMIYIGHRVHQKVREMGLNSHTPTMAERAALRRIDACGLLSKEEVGHAVKIEIVRAESLHGEDPGCVYSVSGDRADMTAKHVTTLHKGEMNQRGETRSMGLKCRTASAIIVTWGLLVQSITVPTAGAQTPFLTFKSQLRPQAGRNVAPNPKSGDPQMLVQADEIRYDYTNELVSAVEGD